MARGDKKTTHNDRPTTKGKDCDEREREKLSSRQSMREREREREVKLKTKHLICNMKFFEIRFLVTIVLHVCPSL
jgi:hypothetical protein